MSSRTILVLGHHARQDLAEALRGIGVEPEVRGSVPGALERLRRGRLTAVLVDRRFIRADALEFVLNVRDIEALVPVIVIGTAHDKGIDQQILQQNYTAVVDESRDMDLLSGELVRVLDLFEDPDHGEQNQRVASGSSRARARMPRTRENASGDA